MKYILFFFLIPVLSFGQIAKDENGLYGYQEVIEATGTKEQLYFKAREWASDEYKTNKAIDYESEDAGTLVIKGIFSGGAWKVKHNLKIETKQDKARITYGNFVVLNGSGMETDLEIAMFKKGIIKNINKEIADSRRKLIAKLQSTSTDDW